VLHPSFCSPPEPPLFSFFFSRTSTLTPFKFFFHYMPPSSILHPTFTTTKNKSTQSY